MAGWATVDDYQLAQGQNADLLYGGMATDAAGNVYAAGEGYEHARESSTTLSG